MLELIILELLIVLFMALPLLRPFIKGLWRMEGLVLCPALALALTIALFPAYGIRPECLPLLVYGIVLNCFNMPSLMAVLGRLKNDDFLDRSLLGSALSLAFLILAGAAALYFAPAGTVDLRTEGVTPVLLRDEGRDVELHLRIYGPGGKNRPLVILLPPAALSISAIDGVCAALVEKGFTVLSYSRRGVDAPAFDETGRRHWLSPGRAFRLLRALAGGTRTAAANAHGRFWEEERMRDLRFILSALPSQAAGRDSVFLAGYGAGGAAVTSLGSDRIFMARNPGIRGIISIEGPVLSALAGESPRQYTLTREETGAFRYIWGNFTALLARLGPAKITGIDKGSLKTPLTPALYLVSYRVTDSRRREDRYGTILESFRSGSAPAVLTAVPGASPIDYSDLPLKYPLLKLFIRREGKPVWSGENYRRNTAALIANFAILVLNGETGITRSALERDITVETNRAWNLGNAGYILRP
jgi:dienelactone hydrolase